MRSEKDIAWIASLVGDPARSRILLALMDGRARTAKELAFFAHISAPTASGHLAKLLDAQLVAVAPQGRHRYFRLASERVGQMIESMAIVAGDTLPALRYGRRISGPLATARRCYDHLAGRAGVAIAEALQRRGHVVFAEDGGEVTASGRAFFSALGLDLARLGATRRVFCRPCLDWTERRHHLAGAVGAALCAHCIERDWFQAVRDSRALSITAEGRLALSLHFGIEADRLTPEPERVAA
jgi:DNA-binding transcriptional ArsR family regulator